jgi:hypothetical protein
MVLIKIVLDFLRQEIRRNKNSGCGDDGAAMYSNGEKPAIRADPHSVVSAEETGGVDYF